LVGGLDRVQAHRPDRLAVPRGRLPLLVLVVLLRLRRAGHAELNAVRVDLESHDALPLDGLFGVVFDSASNTHETRGSSEGEGVKSVSEGRQMGVISALKTPEARPTMAPR